ncbi:MAG: sensor domain-containing protein, partial [Nocardiopsaceae bacterium]|nr:sensor domain-containing protein [Nocardiopsaceae bacterium]
MHRPQTALEALAWRRLLISSWPWRSAGYLIATVPVAIVAGALMAVPAVPWLVLVAGGYPAGAVVLLVLLGAVLIAATSPLIAVPVASLARRRLHLADRQQPGSWAGRENAAGGAVPWLRARYRDPAAWRQTGYACLLATVVPALAVTTLLAAPLAVAFIASPFLVLAQQPGSSPVALFGH